MAVQHTFEAWSMDDKPGLITQIPFMLLTENEKDAMISPRQNKTEGQLLHKGTKSH